jgi:Ni/Fe-hydrogenase subunit HybB-like protein
LFTGYGLWWLVEVLGFILLPSLLYAVAVRHDRVGLVRVASVIAVLGVVLNRLNVSIITYRWNAINRYIPNWQEIVVTLTIVTVGLLTFRWIVNRMPVLREHPDFEATH